MRIYQEDTVHDIAKKIFFDMELHASCMVTGYVEMPDGSISSKGEQVIAALTKLDETENFASAGKKKGMQRRRRKRMENTVGDYIAQKTWKYQKTILDNKVRYTIWRIQ